MPYGDLPFFPAPYSEELLYSVFARQSRWACEGGPKATMETLFGDRSAIASIDLPNRLRTLAGRLPNGMTIDAVIDDHTLAPYYTAFLPADVRVTIRQGMKEDGRSLHLISGMAAFRVSRVTRLRFCPDCLREMDAQFGHHYWRRDHQLPSVLLCPVHATVLRLSSVDLQVANRHGYVPATSTSCPDHAEAIIGRLSSSTEETLLRLGRASADLLRGPNSDVRGYAEMTEFYRDEFRTRSLMRSRDRVDQSALQQAFLERFGSLAKYFPSLLKDGCSRGDWLSNLARRQRKACHPLEHLLLRDLLASRAKEKTPSWAAGPWVCHNPLAEHFNQSVVTGLSVYRNRSVHVTVFACACGYKYTRSLNEAGELGPVRFKEFGPLLQPALSNMVSSGMSLRSIAANLKLDPKTVATLAARSKIATRWSLKPSGNAVRTKSITSSRSFPAPRRRPRGTRHDWQKIDLSLLGKINPAAKAIRAACPPTRVTMASLERELIGRNGWIGKRISKLPCLVSAIAGAIEPLEDFQNRRIDYWIQQESGSGMQIRAWSIMRKAGVRSRLLQTIEDRIALMASSHKNPKRAAA